MAIYVKENYHTEEIPLQTTLEAVAVKIFCDRIVTICNLYIPPDRVINHSEIENITSQLNHPVIILGDFKVKSNAWGIDNEVQNQQGKEIENLLLNNSQLCLLNNGAPTHFSTRFGSFSAIDLTICTSDIVHVLDWNQINNLYGSDHYPLLIKYTSSNSFNQVKIERWIYKIADWDKFKSIIISEINTIDEIEQMQNIILKAAEQSIPKSKNKQQKSVPRWTSEVRHAIKDYKSMMYKIKKPQYNTPENRDLFKILRSKARQIIKDAKRAS